MADLTPERIAELRSMLSRTASRNDLLCMWGIAKHELIDEIDRLRAVIRETHRECMTPPHVFSSGSLHAPTCKLYEIEP